MFNPIPYCTDAEKKWKETSLSLRDSEAEPGVQASSLSCQSYQHFLTEVARVYSTSYQGRSGGHLRSCLGNSTVLRKQTAPLAQISELKPGGLWVIWHKWKDMKGRVIFLTLKTDFFFFFC